MQAAAAIMFTLLWLGTVAAAGPAPSRVIVKLKDREPGSEVIAASTVMAQAIESFQAAGTVKAASALLPGDESLYLVAADSPEGAKSLARSLSQHSDVEYAELDVVLHATVMPSDCSSSDCSTADNLYWGQQYINAPDVWRKSSGFGGSSKIGVVIDTGSQVRHPDLAGLVDSSLSVNMCSDPVCSGVAPGVDDNSHGSHCAGTILASHRNGANTPIGIMDSGRIYSCKFLDSKGQGSTSDAIRCINDAITKRVSVMSNSWGGGFTQSLSAAVQDACRAGILFVVAAGNNNKVMTADPESYPGRFGGDPQSYPCVLTVAASTSTGTRAGYSNYGSPHVEIAAPGSQIFSCYKEGSGKMSGTSMATPFIAGCALGLWNTFPSLSYQQIKRVLVESGKTRPLSDISGGVVDLARAYSLAQSYSGRSPDPPPTSCTSDAACAAQNPSMPFCNPSVGCVACNYNSQCPSTAPVCAGNTCGPCTSDSSCSPFGMFCNFALGACVQCMSNVQCSGSTPVCSNGICRPATPQPPPQCSSNSGCRSAAAAYCTGDGVCTPCSTDSHCAGTTFGPYCVAGTCTSQQPSTGCTYNYQCPSSAPFCDAATGKCGPGASSGSCTSDSSCSSSPDKPFCSPSGKCVSCLAPEHCSLSSGWTAACVNRVCQEGACLYYNNLGTSCTTPFGTAGTCTAGKCTTEGTTPPPVCKSRGVACTKHKDCCSKSCARKKMQCN